jgi:DNA primase
VFAVHDEGIGNKLMSFHVSKRGEEDSSIKDMLDNVDMESWLDYEGVTYKLTSGSSGEQVNLKDCPRCGGDSWKVYLNRDNGLGNCFHGSCSGLPGFNKFSFIHAALGNESKKLTFQSIEKYVMQSGWRPKRVEKVVLVNTDDIKLPPSKEIPINEKNLKYLANRNINIELAKKFNLRYCSKGYYEYVDMYGETRYQRYHKRIIIPIYDMTGNLVTFQGRDITGLDAKKYIFPPMLASTGKYLYNANNATTVKDIVIGEGVFDVFSISKALASTPLFSNYEAVGSFGISFSLNEDQQLGQLKLLIESGLSSVTFMWDGGRKATLAAFKSAIDVQERIKIPVYIALLPKDKDPNEVSSQVLIDSLCSRISATKMNMLRVLSKK